MEEDYERVHLTDRGYLVDQREEVEKAQLESQQEIPVGRVVQRIKKSKNGEDNTTSFHEPDKKGL